MVASGVLPCPRNHTRCCEDQGFFFFFFFLRETSLFLSGNFQSYISNLLAPGNACPGLRNIERRVLCIALEVGAS